MKFIEHMGEFETHLEHMGEFEGHGGRSEGEYTSPRERRTGRAENKPSWGAQRGAGFCFVVVAVIVVFPHLNPDLEIPQGDRNNMMVDASGGDTKNDLERGFFGSSKASWTLTKASWTLICSFNLFLILMPGLWIV